MHWGPDLLRGEILQKNKNNPIFFKTGDFLGKFTPVFQGQLTTWGEKSLPGGNSPPLLYIALWGVEIPPPLTELSHGKGGEFTRPLRIYHKGNKKIPWRNTLLYNKTFTFYQLVLSHLPAQNQLSTLRHSDIGNSLGEETPEDVGDLFNEIDDTSANST